MLALVAAAATFIAAFALVFGVLAARSNPAEARLFHLAQRRQVTLDAPFLERVVEPLFRSFGSVGSQFFPQSFSDRVSRSLDSAGWPMTGVQFLYLMLASCFIAAAFPISLSLLSSGSVGSAALFGGVLLGAIGLFFPVLALRRAVRGRQTAVWRSLPDAGDLITLSVEAGLGVDAALRLVSQKLQGPLADEFAHALREIGLGRPRREALEALADRVDVPELGTFVQALIQTDQLGTALGTALRAQGMILRTQRRQKAEELVRKAPVKMVFPLVLFTMPSFFIITIGPVGVRLVNYLSG